LSRSRATSHAPAEAARMRGVLPALLSGRSTSAPARSSSSAELVCPRLIASPRGVETCGWRLQHSRQLIACQSTLRNRDRRTRWTATLERVTSLCGVEAHAWDAHLSSHLTV
jgi:hypothetical protein